MNCPTKLQFSSRFNQQDTYKMINNINVYLTDEEGKGAGGVVVGAVIAVLIVLVVVVVVCLQ